MKLVRLMLVLIGVALLGGCAGMGHLFCTEGCVRHTQNSSSLVNFLYPAGNVPPPDHAVPELHVPLRVGLAFLPSQVGARTQLDAAHKEELLTRIRQRFLDRKFVSEIVIIPDYYLDAQRGFAGLDGVKRLYSVDVMALVSYDQVMSNEDNTLSLAYLTIIGAYVVPGTRHETATLVDLAVVDPVTRSLVLRAGGTDSRAGNSTLIDVAKDQRGDAAKSFDVATDRMIANFDAALTSFEEAVHAGRASVRVVDRNHPDGGGGSFGEGGLVGIAALLAARLMYRRYRSSLSSARQP